MNVIFINHSSGNLQRLVLGCEALVSLLGDGQLDAAALGQGDEGLRAFADDEDVGQAGCERVTVGVLKEKRQWRH